jgi:hypothetical protein
LGNKRIRSIYIDHIQIIGLGDFPFSSTGSMRSDWSPIFESPTCFSDQIKSARPYSNQPFPSLPFIKKLGAFSFTGQSTEIVRSRSDLSQADVLESLKKKVVVKEGDPEYDYYIYQKLYEEELEEEYLGKKSYFGYIPDIPDQRMNFLCFELKRPLFLKVKRNDDISVHSKINLHIYPSGYLALLFTTSLTWEKQKSIEEVGELIRETYPWRKESHWIWSSRAGEGHLPEILLQLYKYIQYSLFEEPETFSLKIGTWNSLVKIGIEDEELVTPPSPKLEGLSSSDMFKASDAWEEEKWKIQQRFSLSAEEGEQFVSRLLSIRGQPEILEIQLSKKRISSYLFSSKQGLAFIFPHFLKKRRSQSLIHFWKKLLVLTEFVTYESRIYQDYERLLRVKVAELKEYRLSLKLKLTEEKLTRLSVFDPRITRFLSALDSHILNVGKFHRRIYSAISTGVGFDAQRKKVKELVAQWEEEIPKWEPPLYTIWKKFLYPIYSLLKPKLPL